MKSPVEVNERLPWALAWRLACGQIVAWGILFYAFTVIVGPMQAGTGWSRTFLNGGLSLGLLVWGVLALPVGAWIQRRGGRGIMTGASALGGCALIVMGLAPHRIWYLVAWLLLGIAMAGVLYDSAFAVVTRAFGASYRRGITLITLVGGLASTVFIPVAQWTVDWLGWQQALVTLGVFQIAIGVPLHAWGIPRFERDAPGLAGNDTYYVSLPASAGAKSRRGRWSEWVAEFGRDVSDPRFLGLALWFTAHAAAFTGLIFQIVPLLQALNVESKTILQAIAVIGPMQVLGRFVLTTRGNHFCTLRVGRWAMASLIASAIVLLVLPPRVGSLVAFAVLFGVGNGVLTILRGTSIAEIFGRERYAELNGALSAPAVLAKAAAPLALAALWSVTGEPRVVFAAVLGLLLLGTGGLWITAAAQRRQAARAAAGGA